MKIRCFITIKITQPGYFSMLMQGTESLSVAVLGVHKLRLGHFVANEQRLCMQMLFMDYFEDKILKIS